MEGNAHKALVRLANVLALQQCTLGLSQPEAGSVGNEPFPPPHDPHPLLKKKKKWKAIKT